MSKWVKKDFTVPYIIFPNIRKLCPPIKYINGIKRLCFLTISALMV